MEQHTKELYERLQTLTILRPLLQEPLLQSFSAMMESMLSLAEENKTALSAAVSAYCDFTSEIYRCYAENEREISGNFSCGLYGLLFRTETDYLKAKARKKEFSPFLEQQLDKELEIIQNLSLLTAEEVQKSLQDAGFTHPLPRWETSVLDFHADYRKHLDALPYTGYGMYAQYHTFLFRHGAIYPVKHPDMQTLEDLTGYERERNQVLRNTQVFLEGGTASNVLLYGDAGTGKSTTVKAIANSLQKQGLRLLEVKKNELYELPDILDELSGNPLKFIIFIDDLSFSSNDDNFAALKAILEGGVASCGKNVLIYATSNRRHLVKETMTERQGDELYLNDTLQETMSLAARFGLTITFQKPGKDDYLSIVKHLAKQYGVSMDAEELCIKAEAFAIRCNGRSPRTAKHFIELQKAGI